MSTFTWTLSFLEDFPSGFTISLLTLPSISRDCNCLNVDRSFSNWNAELEVITSNNFPVSYVGVNVSSLSVYFVLFRDLMILFARRSPSWIVERLNSELKGEGGLDKNGKNIHFNCFSLDSSLLLHSAANGGNYFLSNLPQKCRVWSNYYAFTGRRYEIR